MSLELKKHWALSGIGQEVHCTEYQVWDEHGRLAYVGIADDFRKRWSQHVRSSWWLGEIRVARIEVTGWPSREAARMSEASAINEQSPVFNTALELGSYRLARFIEDWPAPVDRSIYSYEGAA